MSAVSLSQVDLGQVLFLDIETVPAWPAYSQVPEALQKHWLRKAQTKFRVEETEAAEAQYGESAGLFAEFGKVVCVSVGMLQGEGENQKFFLKSFAGDDEHALLTEFAAFLSQLSQRPDEPARGRRRIYHLCAHNGMEFDFPYLGRRMLVLGIPLPALLNMQGKKPWEVPHIDTLQLWSFGDRKAYTGLALLAEVFGIPTPKGDIDGSDVARVYWQEHDLDRIVQYCQRDVVTVVRLLQKMMYLPPVADEHVSVIAG